MMERLEQEMATLAQHGVQYWPIFLLDSGQHVGCCGLRPRRNRQDTECSNSAHESEENVAESRETLEAKVFELGFHIRPEFWRQGLAAEAAQGVIRYAFQASPQGLGAHSLFAGHNPHNGVSKALLERLGFQWTHDEFYPPTGLQHPSYRLTPS